jgi:hypothetical protein
MGPFRLLQLVAVCLLVIINLQPHASCAMQWPMPTAWHKHAIYTTDHLSAWVDKNPGNVTQRINAAAGTRDVTHVCSLYIQGDGQGNVSRVDMSCNSTSAAAGGRSLEVDLDGMVEGPDVITSFEGIEQIPGGCGVPLEYDSTCLVKLCGAADSIIIHSASVTGLSGAVAAICANGSVHLQLDGTEFVGNSNGASLLRAATEADAVVLRVTKSVFAGNNDSVGLWVSGTAASTMAMISSCTFTGNVGTSGIHILREPVVMIEGCTFAGNKANGTATSALTSSPAFVKVILNSSAEVVVMNSSFSGNTGHGLIRVETLSWDDSRTRVHVHLVNITGNEHVDDQASLSLRGPNGSNGTTGIISNCTFINNTMSSEEHGKQRGVGRLVYGFCATVAVINTEFSDNEGLSAVYGFQESEITVVRSSFLGNYMEVPDLARGGGGVALAGSLNANVTAFSSEFKNNRVVYGSGGAALVSDRAQLAIHDCHFENNTAAGGQGGAALHLSRQASAVVLDGCTFNSNRAESSSGGAISVIEHGRALLNGNSTFKVNRADVEGGAVFVRDSTASVTIFEGVIFSDNISPGSGLDVKAIGDATLRFVGDTNITAHSSTVVWIRTTCFLGEYRQPGLGGVCQRCAPATFSFAETNSINHACVPCPRHAKCPGGDTIIPDAGFWRSSSKSTQVHACPRGNTSCNLGGQCNSGYTGNLCGKCVHKGVTSDEGNTTTTIRYGSQGPFSCGECMPVWKVVMIYLSVAVVLTMFLCYLVHTTLNDLTTGSISQRQSVAAASTFLKLLIRHWQYLVIISSIRIEWPNSISVIFTWLSLILSIGSGQIVSLDCLYNSDVGGGAPLAVKSSITTLLAPFLIFLIVLCVYGLFHMLSRRWFQARKSAPSVDQNSPGHQTFQQSAVKGAAGCSSVVDEEGHEALRHQSGRFASKLMFAVVFLVVLFFFYPALVRVGLQFLACLKIDVFSSNRDGSPSDPFPQHALANASNGYWVLDIEQPCFEGWHLKWALGLGLPCVVVFCIVVPLATLWLLWRARHHVGNLGTSNGPAAAVPVAFLYADYKSTMYYWEVVSTVQIASVTALSVFTYTLDAYHTMLLLNLAIVLYGGLLVCFKPYACNVVHRTAVLSMATLYLTSYLALTLLRFTAEPPSEYKEVVGVVGLVVNAAFVLWCMYQVGRHGAGMAAKLWEGLKACGTCWGLRRGRSCSHQRDALLVEMESSSSPSR